MRIGVNALYLLPGGVGGTEIYLRALLEAMGEIARGTHEIVVFTNRETGADVAGDVTVLPQSVSAANRIARIAYEQVVLPIQCSRHGIDVLFNPGFTAPMLAPCPQVTVFHDMQHKRHPEFFRWFDLPAWRALLFQSACCSGALVAVSEATKVDLLRYYPIDAGKVHVVQHGVEERLFGLARKPEPVLLYVSTLHPHKNHVRLVRVFAKFREGHSEWKLVLAGMRGFHAGAVEAEIAAQGLTESVRITGWIPRDELLSLYKRAGACIYPSTFEGFGMPVIESLAAGIPSACSDIEPLRSLVGETALLFDPLDDDAMLQALENLLREPPTGGPEHAGQFRWKKCAQQVIDIIAQQ